LAEGDFWKNYFYRVSMLKQQVLLNSAASSIMTSQQQNQLQQEQDKESGGKDEASEKKERTRERTFDSASLILDIERELAKGGDLPTETWEDEIKDIL
jgi:hypothetical protein